MQQRRFFLCAKFCRDLNKLRPEKFLTCIDMILPRSYQGVSRNFWYNGLGKSSQVLQESSRSCMTWQGVSSFVSLGYIYF